MYPRPALKEKHKGASIILQDVSVGSGGMLTFFSQELEAGRSGWGSVLFDGWFL